MNAYRVQISFDKEQLKTVLMALRLGQEHAAFNEDGKAMHDLQMHIETEEAMEDLRGEA